MGRILMWVAIAIAIYTPMTLAQTQTQTLQEPPDVYSAPAPQTSRDPPLGFPYNTGNVDTGGNADMPVAQVPLRDFLSSRQDLQYADLSRQISQLGAFMQQVIDERDRQYAQRFAAQQDAVESALRAAQEAVQAALESAERATTKAEDAANDRFESVNEFRATLADQANNFMNKDTAEAHHRGLDEKVEDLFIRVNTIQAEKRGGLETWGFMALVGGFVVGVFGVLYGLNKDRREIVVRERERTVD